MPPRSGDLSKPLKEQNRWQLCIIFAGNTFLLYALVQAKGFDIDGLRSIFGDPKTLVPVGFAVVATAVLNGVLSADTKARLVFLRWHNALPGHRAFSHYASSDPRIDFAALTRDHGAALPVDPVEQNRTWYRIYKTVENEPSVNQVHRDFLLLRDYTGLSVLFFVFYGGVGFFALPSIRSSALYLLLLIIQFGVVRLAASNYGIRLVTTVLAQKTTKIV
jgi:hypothetical protein